MRKKKKPIDFRKILEWNVLWFNPNEGKIVVRDVFTHGSFREDCISAAKEHGDDRNAFIAAVKRAVMMYFWSKCEEEVFVTDCPNESTKHKVDTSDQLMMNWHIFCDYIWSHIPELLEWDRSRK